jgi:energy-coupling factor transporter ATP-binding protein EcfA2
MKGIHTLKIKNFKAFPIEQEFNFEGKHVLIYGENGSGKSSIYWALYTLLQSSIVGKKTAKYFQIGGNDSLLNTNTGSDESAVRIRLCDQKEEGYFLLDKRGFQSSEIGANRLGEMNLSSDFISYRLMMNIFNIKHSETVDLWHFFEKDILPFLEDGKQQNWNTLYNDIINTRPYALREGILKNTQPTNNLFKAYQAKIDYFNEILLAKLADILLVNVSDGKAENRISRIYNELFQEAEGKLYEFDIVSTSLKFEKRKYQEERSGTTYPYEANNFWDISKPQLRLSVRENGVDIVKPHSFFNEARLTRIALAIRLAILETRPKIFEHRILVLDDLLISLDMSNREAVLDALLNKYQNKFQLIILTHERSFFELIRRTVNHEHNLSDWKLFEMYENEDKLQNPIVVPSKDYT